jgi:hypothetical protein
MAHLVSWARVRYFTWPSFLLSRFCDILAHPNTRQASSCLPSRRCPCHDQTTTWPLPPPLTAPPTASRVSLAAVLPSPLFGFAAASVRPGPSASPKILSSEAPGAARRMSPTSSAEGEVAGEFTEVVIVRHR